MTGLADLVEQACRASTLVTVIPNQRGWGPDDLRSREEAYSKPWSVRRRGDRFEIALRDEPHDRNTPLTPTLNARHVVVDALAAALWRLCVELPDGTKTCTACPPTRGPMLFETSGGARTWRRQNRRKVDWAPQTTIHPVDGRWGLWVYKFERWACWEDAPHRTCETCGDTRIVPRPEGDIALGAMRSEGHDREELAVLADSLMQNSDALGEWLALWLGGVKCRQCRGRRVIDVPAAMVSAADYTTSDDMTEAGYLGRVGDDIEHRSVNCSHCHGWGVELFAHEQAIADRLDAFTWIRDRLPEVGDEIELPQGNPAPGYAVVHGGRVSNVGDDRRVEIGGVIVVPVADGWRYRVPCQKCRGTGREMSTADERYGDGWRWSEMGLCYERPCSSCGRTGAVVSG